ncbi:restriction endonuclease subunit S [Streptomyces sp. NPDC026659]|uniref:restriction endonuclease subunit S n=1 Tax=Streptomyces sp. NPDC026659 TaxID=3155123 RepID=UPI0033F810AB
MSDWQQIPFGDLETAMRRKGAIPPQESRVSRGNVWPRVALSELVVQRRDAVKIESGAEYRLLGVRWYGEGAFHRETVTRETSKATTVYKVTPGQFIYNRLFAGKGSFGLVLPELAGAFVSNEFPLFDTDPERLSVEYLNLYFQQRRVWDYVETVSTGTTASRNRWKESQFLAYRIPLPSLPVQQRIVEIISAVDDQITALDEEAEALDRVSMAVAGDLLANEPVVALGTMLNDIRGGRSPQADKRPPGADELGVLKVSAVAPFRFVPEESKTLLPGTSMPESALVRPGDVLITRANTPLKVGAVARVPVDVRQGLYLADKTLRLVPSSKLDPDFLVVAMALKSARSHLTSSATGTSASMFNVSQDRIRETPIPLPDLDRQREVSSAVMSVRANADATRAEAARLRGARSGLLASLLDRTTKIESAELGV